MYRSGMLDAGAVAVNRNPGKQHVVVYRKAGEGHQVYDTVYQEDVGRLRVKQCYDRHPEAEEVYVAEGHSVPHPKGGRGIGLEGV